MERAIEIFAAVNFFVIGFSHIFQHRAWAELFVRLHEQGRPGAFANGLLHMLMGTLIVSFHNVWEGAPMLLTLLGWAFVLKAAVVLLCPDWGLKSMARVRLDNSRLFMVPGAVMVVVSLALGYSIWIR